MNKIKKLEDQIFSLTASLNAVKESLTKYYKNASNMLEVEHINRIRRYGVNEFTRIYLSKKTVNISDYMKIYSFSKVMESELKKSYKFIYKEILKLNKKLYMLKEINE